MDSKVVINKSKCQKFTPPDMVNKLLDVAKYSKNLFGKKVLENSFGSGNIIIEIVNRYIDDCFASGISGAVISKGLENDIYGIELDKKLFSSCKKELNKIVADNNLPPVSWCLYNEDALGWTTNLRFDFVIGNPPYITYKELNEDIRTKLRAQFKTCEKGKFDYYYAFIESGIELLSDTGKLIQLVPNNIYKNVFAKSLRMMLKKHISLIIDFPAQKIFGEVHTSSSILIYDKTYNKKYFIYKNDTERKEFLIQKENLKEKWEFSQEKKSLSNGMKFGDFFHASIVVATLLNEAYIVNKEIIDEYKLESAVLRKAASPRGLRYGIAEYIIFPYYYCKQKLNRYNPGKFAELFPNTSKYLKLFKTKLELRDSEKNIQWYEYGRSQALSHINQDKLLLSTVVSNQVDIYKLDSATIPYSGIYITDKSKHSLKYACKILESNEFLMYVKGIGININGNSVRITCRDINNFKFSKELFNWNI